MSLIRFGTQDRTIGRPALVSFSGDDEVGLRIWTPSAIQSLIDEVKTETRAIGLMVRDGMKAKGGDFLSKGELEAFKDFYNEVNRWLASNPSKYWGANVDRANDYKGRLREWRQLLIARGGTPVAPAPAAPIDHKAGSAFELSTGMKVVLGIGAAAALAFGISSIAGKVTPSRAPAEQP